MGYCVASGGNLLWGIVWRVEVICYVLFCSEWWQYTMGYCVASGGNLLRVILWLVVAICYGLLCGEWW
jgi:hypothetical protein